MVVCYICCSAAAMLFIAIVISEAATSCCGCVPKCMVAHIWVMTECACLYSSCEADPSIRLTRFPIIWAPSASTFENSAGVIFVFAVCCKSVPNTDYMCIIYILHICYLHSARNRNDVSFALPELLG